MGTVYVDEKDLDSLIESSVQIRNVREFNDQPGSSSSKFRKTPVNKQFNRAINLNENGNMKVAPV